MDLSNYRHVDQFGDDAEYEDEEEVTYLTLDLGTVQPTLLSSSTSYKLIELDSETPFLQLSGTIFKGQHNSLLGTELIFTEDTNDRNKKGLSFVGTTESRVSFKEVQLVPKGTAPEAKVKNRKGTAAVVASIERGESPAGVPVDRLTGKKAPKERRTRKRQKDDDDD